MYAIVFETISNLFLINYFYIIWNSFEYLIALLFIFIGYFSNFLFIFKIIFFYYFSQFYFFSENSYIFLSIDENLLLNPLLTNSLNRVHPLLLHFSLIFLVINIKYINKKNNILNFYLLNTLTISIFLGSWWAFQEGNWGGWWEWDPSEFLSLIMLIAVLIRFHFNSSNNFKIYKNYLIILNSFLVFFYFIFLNIYFSNTSHNFTLSINYFFNSFLFKFFIIILIILIVFKLIKTTKLQSFFILKNFLIINYLCIFILLLIFSIKKLFVFNLFTSGFINLNFSNLTVWVLLIALVNHYLNLSYKYFFLNTYLEILLFKKKITLVLIKHFFILMFLFFSLNYFFIISTNFTFFNIVDINYALNNLINITNNSNFINVNNFNQILTKNFYSDISKIPIIFINYILFSNNNFFSYLFSYTLFFKYYYIKSIFLITLFFFILS